MSRATFIHSVKTGMQHLDRAAGFRRMCSHVDADRKIPHIILDVATSHGLTYDKITGKSRDARICQARHEAVLMAHETGRYSLSQIGRAFGGRDHTTILNSIKRGRELRARHD